MAKLLTTRPARELTFSRFRNLGSQEDTNYANFHCSIDFDSSLCVPDWIDGTGTSRWWISHCISNSSTDACRFRRVRAESTRSTGRARWRSCRCSQCNGDPQALSRFAATDSRRLATGKVEEGLDTGRGKREPQFDPKRSAIDPPGASGQRGSGPRDNEQDAAGFAQYCSPL